jgi:hypothetical protein
MKIKFVLLFNNYNFTFHYLKKTCAASMWYFSAENFDMLIIALAYKSLWSILYPIQV